MANCYTSLFAHIIFSTHNREPLLKSEWRERLFAYKEYNVDYDERYVWG